MESSELPHLDAFGIVPLTWSAALILGVCLAITAVGWARVAEATGWRPVPTAVAGVCLAVVAALTLGPGSESTLGRVPCVWPSESLAGVLAEVGHDLESALNAVLLMPLGVVLVLAVRRPLVPVLVVAMLPGVVEASQSLIPGRFCSPADYLLNVVGGLAGVGLGVIMTRLERDPCRT